MTCEIDGQLNAVDVVELRRAIASTHGVDVDTCADTSTLTNDATQTTLKRRRLDADVGGNAAVSTLIGDNENYTHKTEQSQV